MHTVCIGMVNLNIGLGFSLFVKEHKRVRSVDYHEVMDGTHILINQNLAPRRRIAYGAVRGRDLDAHVSWRVEVTLTGRRGIVHAASIMDGRW